MGFERRFEICIFIFSALLVIPGAACEQAMCGLKAHAKIEDQRVKESSGLAVSRRFEDVFWTHNDDGPALVFAVGLDGRKIRAYDLPIQNHDWEDIALDGKGNLYLLDNTSRDDNLHRVTVHVFPEPDPYRDEQVTSVETFTVRYPDRGYDTETIFVWQDQVFLVTKPWDGSKPRVYVADNMRDSETVFLRMIPYPAMVTGGDISEDGSLVALSSYRALFIFEGKGSLEEILLSDPLVCPLNAGQIEGISWKGRDLILTNEQGAIYWVHESDWRNHEAPFQDFPTARVPRYTPGPLRDKLPDNWERGAWLASSGDEQRITGRVVWNEGGLHVGIQLPEGLEVPGLGEKEREDFDHWFLPGRVYVLINPTGDRQLAFGSNDRCIVVGSQSDGAISCEERTLLPATYIQSSHMAPSWIRSEREGNWILVTLTSDGPGLGQLQSGKKMGFNLLIMGKTARTFSWAPLTLDFSWDAPSFWGLIELVD